ncbi:MAG: DUF488 family protein [Chlamydiae bacterium]|nr:DUF488 family protein [Chlamydiota bacterium]MBI3276610.1 DUF488 family protein [Chlamydiota bacterium]
MIKLKNVYLSPSKEDGERILIERLWPQDADVYLLKIHRWLKDLAPSYALLEGLKEHSGDRAWFNTAYLKELEESEKRKLLEELSVKGKETTVTLLCRETQCDESPAAVIYGLLRQRCG